jgi:hypothetical protein
MFDDPSTPPYCLLLAPTKKRGSPRRYVAAAGNATGHAADAQHGSHIHSYMVLLFLFFALLLGLFSRHLLSGLPIPYTGLLLLWGLAFGYLDKWGDLDQLGDSLKYWRGMDPHLMLHIFIPALLFGSAFTMDLHLVKKCVTQVLLLAGPGVLLATFATGGLIYVVLPYDWSLDTCLMAGSILSATDPVAVVSLLKSVGASKRLGTIIEGESLLNDGTAYVLFLIFLERVQTTGAGGENPQGLAAVGPALEQFAQLALGGPLFGLVMVGLYRLNPVDPQLETAWFHDILVSSLCSQNATCTATSWRTSPCFGSPGCSTTPRLRLASPWCRATLRFSSPRLSSGCRGCSPWWCWGCT